MRKCRRQMPAAHEAAPGQRCPSAQEVNRWPARLGSDPVHECMKSQAPSTLPRGKPFRAGDRPRTSIVPRAEIHKRAHPACPQGELRPSAAKKSDPVHAVGAEKLLNAADELRRRLDPCLLAFNRVAVARRRLYMQQ